MTRSPRFDARLLNDVVSTMRDHYSKFDSAGYEAQERFSYAVLPIMLDNATTVEQKYVAVREEFLADMDDLIAQADGQWFGPKYQAEAEGYVKIIRRAEKAVYLAV